MNLFEYSDLTSSNFESAKNDRLLQTLAALYLIALDLRYITDVSFVGTTALWIVVGVVLFCYCFIKYRGLMMLLPIFLLIDIAALGAIVYNGNHNPMYVAVLVSIEGFGVALFLVRDHLRTLDIIAVASILAINARIVSILIANPGIMYTEVVVSELMRSNAASIFIIMLFFIDLVYIKQAGKAPRYWLMVLSLAVAIVNGGNGSILCLALLTVGVLLLDTSLSRFSKARVALCVVACLVGIAYGFDSVASFLLDDNGRFFIWGEYGALLKNPADWLLGANILPSWTLVYYKQLHNSFLNMHFFFGLFPQLCFIVAIVVASIEYAKTSNYLMILLSIVLVVRAFTDEAMLLFLPLWIFMFIDSFCYNQYKNSNSSQRFSVLEETF